MLVSGSFMAIAAVTVPEQGQIVEVRHRRYVVGGVIRSALPASPLPGGIDQPQHLLREYFNSFDDLYRLTFWRLLDEIEAELGRREQPGMLMVDMRSDMHSSVQDRRLVDAYRDWISSRMGRTHLVELPWFGFSAFYSGLQLADFVAYSVDYLANEEPRPERESVLRENLERLRKRVQLVQIP
jgi:hypothetical protein